ncbi:hypothetical protein DRQ20_04190 [bacterium]|nr:MAG: hypothetical protein DRQ20_04190 [bacterium]
MRFLILFSIFLCICALVPWLLDCLTLSLLDDVNCALQDAPVHRAVCEYAILRRRYAHFTPDWSELLLLSYYPTDPLPRRFYHSYSIVRLYDLKIRDMLRSPFLSPWKRSYLRELLLYLSECETHILIRMETTTR